MVVYKLTYFNIRGLAETARQIFKLAEQPFEDIRVSREEWPTIKTEMPFEQLPVLEVDGQILAQSYAICRYLAREFGYAGRCGWDEAEVDSIADQWKDFALEIRPYFMAAVGLKEGDLAKLYNDTLIPATRKNFQFLTNFLRRNRSSSGFLVGNTVTWVDLLVAEFVDNHAPQEVLIEFPEIEEHRKTIHNIPQIKEWRESRPVTEF